MDTRISRKFPGAAAFLPLSQLFDSKSLQDSLYDILAGSRNLKKVYEGIYSPNPYNLDTESISNDIYNNAVKDLILENTPVRLILDDSFRYIQTISGCMVAVIGWPSSSGFISSMVASHEWPSSTEPISQKELDAVSNLKKLDQDTIEFIGNKNLWEAITWLQKSMNRFFPDYEYEIELMPRDIEEDNMIGLRIFGSLSSTEFRDRRHKICEEMLKADHKDLYDIIGIFQRRIKENGLPKFSYFCPVSTNE